MRYTIEEIKRRTIPIAVAYGISKMSLFGSYARGEAGEESDVDFLVEVGEMQTLIQYYSFVNDLEKELGCHVDVVTTGIEDKEFLKRVKEEEMLIYEQG